MQGRTLVSSTSQGPESGLFRGAFLEKGGGGSWMCGVEEVAGQGNKMLVFKGAFGEMKVAGVPGCKGVFYKGESRDWRRR